MVPLQVQSDRYRPKEAELEHRCTREMSPMSSGLPVSVAYGLAHYTVG